MKITYTEPKNTVKFGDIAIGQTFIMDTKVYVRIISAFPADYEKENVFCFIDYKTYRFCASLSVKPVDVELIVHAEEQ